ncbi:type I-E CRISPR-associated protein Cas7/Cse4/CasC [Pseudodesulfovibrio tunisiensis]|uniref:type I-E CRISPR-associated protein Cas7/Cse4/CasC n=1 Tax=Pseudodesulfovibrio tunisiensis TaxID=463192 RepID=UPI001FB22ED4|nr:type I-E CRISPR-associated protein Cas7/Cse4/CasC [Pseudodesulfovibrio tunisiensis]
MSKFIQLHVLTTYPASNLNRDDLGRPKTVIMGNTQRLRVSSQSLKRAWRISEPFSQALAGHIGTRTKEIGKYVYHALTSGATFAEVMADPKATGSLKTLKQSPAVKIARTIGNVFAKMKADYKPKKDEEFSSKKFLESLETEQMAHVSPAELDGVAQLVEACRETGKEPDKDDLNLLRKDATAVDVALFGRMLAANPSFNVEAAAQVAHAMTVHKATVEDDFFTAVDDLNTEDAGAGHMGVAEFGAGLFYLYLCIDRNLLVENLGNDTELANHALRALVSSVCTVSPTGKQNSFASRAAASYCLAEKGDEQPRTLAEAFLSPMKDSEDLLHTAMAAIETRRDSFNRIFGAAPEFRFFSHEAGTLKEVCDFITE